MFCHLQSGFIPYILGGDERTTALLSHSTSLDVLYFLNLYNKCLWPHHYGYSQISPSGIHIRNPSTGHEDEYYGVYIRSLYSIYSDFVQGCSTQFVEPGIPTWLLPPKPVQLKPKVDTVKADLLPTIYGNDGTSAFISPHYTSPFSATRSTVAPPQPPHFPRNLSTSRTPFLSPLSILITSPIRSWLIPSPTALSPKYSTCPLLSS